MCHVFRFLDPDNPKNSIWSPSSVPAVRTQPWGKNYYDRNIADNPIHPTIQDQLIGLPRIAEQRRAKYMAISRLTEDYMDTTGEIKVVEGELENDEVRLFLIFFLFISMIKNLLNINMAHLYG